MILSRLKWRISLGIGDILKAFGEIWEEICDILEAFLEEFPRLRFF